MFLLQATMLYWRRNSRAEFVFLRQVIFSHEMAFAGIKTVCCFGVFFLKSPNIGLA